MADKEKREDFSREPQRESPPKGAPYWGGAPWPPMEDKNFARRAGEIIARAARIPGDPLDHRGKRK
jgi:hypothetical protein